VGRCPLEGAWTGTLKRAQKRGVEFKGAWILKTKNGLKNIQRRGDKSKNATTVRTVRGKGT